MKKVAMVTDRGYARLHNTLTEADLAPAAAECQIYQQQSPTLNPSYGTIPWGDQSATWWQVDYLCGKDRFVFTGIDTYSDNGFAFHPGDASAKTIIWGLTECLVHCRGILHKMLHS